MIVMESVSFSYSPTAAPVLSDVSLRVGEGELCLVIGSTGSGKSTLLQMVNGLVPHFTGGVLSGRVLVDGRDTAEHRPRDLADLVGFVAQDPSAGFVADTVEEELAYVVEQLGLPPNVMRKRVEEVLDVMGLAELRRRPLATLSGGQQQRTAIAAVLTSHPRVLVLDEPTSALDPTAAEEVLASLVRLVHDLGITALVAEHRLERIVEYADVVVDVPGDGGVDMGLPGDIVGRSDIAPPVVELARLAGWETVPLSVRDARRQAGLLRLRLGVPPANGSASVKPPGLSARDVTVSHHPVVAVRQISLDLRSGEVTAVMGRNGSGKTSLLWALQGSGPRDAGSVDVSGRDPADLSPAAARRLVGLVPQTPSDLLYLDTVGAECVQADRDAGVDDGTTRAILDRLAPGIPDDRHPRDCSEGQRLALVLAIQLSARPTVVLLDEPTRGLDYRAKRALTTILRSLAQRGVAVAVSTHDVEFVAGTADRVVVLAEGEVVADGSSREVVLASPAYAPQVAKVLAPLPFLTVEQVAAALDVS